MKVINRFESILNNGDEEVCFVCKKPFTLFHKRHICKRCGQSLHLKCCEQQKVMIPVPNNSPAPETICPPCFIALDAIRRPLQDDIVAMHLSTRTTGFIYRGPLLDVNEIIFASPDRSEWVRSTVCLLPPIQSSPTYIKGSHTCIARSLPIIQPPFSLISDKRRHTMISSILSFKHPCICELKKFEYLPERNSLMSIRQSHVRGSLKDMIYGIPLSQRFVQKRSYGLTKGLPISPAGVARYGRHILEGLCYFKFFGFPYPYLHAGNVLVTEHGCVLTDFENVVPGIPPAMAESLASVQDPSLWEIISFGLLLFEMATGKKPAQKLGSPLSEAPEYVRATLKSIFPDGVVGGKGCGRKPETTLEKLALGPLFGPVKSEALDAIQKKGNVFAGPIEKSVATYFRKLTPALEGIIKMKGITTTNNNSGVIIGSEVNWCSDDTQKKKKKIVEFQKKKYHKSSGRVKEAPEPSLLSDVIKRKDDVKKEVEIDKLENDDDDGDDGEIDNIENVNDKKKKKDSIDDLSISSDSDSSDSGSDSGDLSDDFKDIVVSSSSDSDLDFLDDKKSKKKKKNNKNDKNKKSTTSSEKKKKKKKKVEKDSSDDDESSDDSDKKEKKVKKKGDKDKDDEAQRFIEAYGFKETLDDDSFDIFDEYEEPKEEEVDAKVAKREPRRVKI